MTTQQATPGPSVIELRDAVRSEYAEVAVDPAKGFHFHTGVDAASRLDYKPALYADLPEGNIASFAGTGNPFLARQLAKGETVIDAGSGAGFDSLIAGTMVGPTGQVIGIDMTQEMLAKARAGAEAMDAEQVEFRDGLIEELPLGDGLADVVISNGVLNLTVDKVATLSDWYRVLKPGGRIQIGDILVGRKVSDAALNDISLWTG